MRKRHWIAVFAAVGLLLGCSQAADEGSLIIDHNCVDANDNIIPQDALDKARALKVLFGHESVGFNVIQGLERLGGQVPRYRLDIGHMIEPWWYRQHSGLGEFFVRNMNNVPGKATAFEQKLRSGVGDLVQVASLKLCWADLQPSAPAGAADTIFTAYTGVLERMQQAYPNVKFVYWSMPLRRDTQMADERQHFNERLAVYAKRHKVIVFDIADIESHKPDGNVFTDEAGHLSLWDGYTQDRGHLNEVGAARVARAWWWLTARLAGWPGN